MAFTLPPDTRQTVLKNLDKVPPRFETRLHNRQGCYSNAEAVRLTRLQLQSTAIAEMMEQIAASPHGRTVLKTHLRGIIKYFLVFIPEEEPVARNRWIEEIVKARRLTKNFNKSGFGEKILISLIRDPEITEDQIKRVQKTHYCARPYDPLDAYRDFQVWRGKLTMTPPNEIPEKMKELVKWVNSARAKRLPPVIRAALFAARYDKIHPFGGRTKHASCFFAAKIILQGRNGISLLPIVDPYTLSTSFAFTPEPQTPKDQTFGEIPSLFINLFLGNRPSLLDLAFQERHVEYVFNFLVHYYNSMTIFYEFDRMKDQELINQIRTRICYECSPEKTTYIY